MTYEELKDDIHRRFVIVYSYSKMSYLKGNGFLYLFKCFNEGKRCNFYIYDKTPQIQIALKEFNLKEHCNNN